MNVKLFETIKKGTMLENILPNSIEFSKYILNELTGITFFDISESKEDKKIIFSNINEYMQITENQYIKTKDALKIFDALDFEKNTDFLCTFEVFSFITLALDDLNENVSKSFKGAIKHFILFDLTLFDLTYTYIFQLYMLKKINEEEIKKQAEQNGIDFKKMLLPSYVCDNIGEIGEFLFEIANTEQKSFETINKTLKEIMIQRKKEREKEHKNLDDILKEIYSKGIEQAKKNGKTVLFDIAESIYNSQENEKNNVKTNKHMPIGDFKEPRDKITQSIFAPKNKYHIALYSEPEGINIITGNRGDKKATVFVNIDVTGLENSVNLTLSKEINDFDWRVYNTIGNLALSGNTFIAIEEIYKYGFKNMNGNTRMSKDMRKKIWESIEKMSSTKITIDTKDEQEKGYKYSYFFYRDFLLPVTILKARNIRGHIVEGISVKYTKYPTSDKMVLNLPLFEFAISRKQIVSFPCGINSISITRTETVLKIENRLQTRIARKDTDILLKDLFEYADVEKGVTNKETLKKRRASARKTIDDLLTEYKRKGIIKGFEKTKNAKGEEKYILTYKQ